MKMRLRDGAWTWMLVALMLMRRSRAAEFSLGKYGAKADGKTDDSHALLKAFADACQTKGLSKIVVPKGTYAMGPLTLKGPCAAPIIIQAIGATFLAPQDPNRFKSQRGWLIFQAIDRISLIGGTYDGQGQIAWKQNNWKGEGCLKSGKCPPIPVNFNIHAVTNVLFKDITSKDSKNFHLNCISSTNVTFTGVKIKAPGESPNTDGIHLARGTDLKVLDTVIETGDDCISMGDGLTNVLIDGVKCGPGHGISIGSLGKKTDEKDVTGITIQKCTFINTSNGVRIKTWPSAPGTIKVSDLKFQSLTMVNASNPIIIDQQYCPWNLCSLSKPSLIQISKVKIADVKGTSGSQEVLIFSCSSSKPCQGVEIGNIDLKFTGNHPKLGSEATTKCENIKYTSTGKQNPPLCKSSKAPVQKIKLSRKMGE